MLNRDDYILGAVIGVVVPLIAYGLIMAGLHLFRDVDSLVYAPRPGVPALVAIFFNLFPFRYYMVSKRYDKTGRGILLVTFAVAVVFFYFYL